MDVDIDGLRLSFGYPTATIVGVDGFEPPTLCL